MNSLTAKKVLQSNENWFMIFFSWEKAWNSYLEWQKLFFLKVHSILFGISIKLKNLSTGPAQGEWACITVSEYVMFEILDWRP